MSEITDAQEEIKKLTTYPDKGTNLIYMLTHFCSMTGQMAETLEPFINQDEIPRDLKLDLWEFAVIGNRLKDHAAAIRTGKIVIPSTAVTQDLGEIGNKGKLGLAKILEAYSELARVVKVNLRELFEIAKNKRSA